MVLLSRLGLPLLQAEGPVLLLGHAVLLLLLLLLPVSLSLLLRTASASNPMTVRDHASLAHGTLFYEERIGSAEMLTTFYRCLQYAVRRP